MTTQLTDLKPPKNPLSPLGWVVVITLVAVVTGYLIWAIGFAEPLFHHISH